MAVLSRTAKQTYHGTPDSVLAGCLQVLHAFVSCFVFWWSLAPKKDVLDHGAGNVTA